MKIVRNGEDRPVSGTDDDLVKELVSVGCDVAYLAIWLNDADGLRLAGAYMTRAADLVAEEARVEHPSYPGYQVPPVVAPHLARRLPFDGDSGIEDAEYERYHDRHLGDEPEPSA